MNMVLLVAVAITVINIAIFIRSKVGLTDETKRINEHYDKLMQQEQLDRIERNVSKIKKMADKSSTSLYVPRFSQECIEELKERHGLTPNSNRNKEENKYPDPSKWLENYQSKTNRYGNKFILQSIFGHESLQCVTCGNLHAEIKELYQDETLTVTQYKCNQCGNTYTVREGEL